MKQAGKFKDGLSLHYYTVTGDWPTSGATQFTENDWYKQCAKPQMEQLVTGHSQIMDRYDPEKALVCSWMNGNRHDVEPEQTLVSSISRTPCDALVAGINLNIFNKHSVKVAWLTSK